MASIFIVLIPFLVIGILVLTNFVNNLKYFYSFETSDKKPVKLERDLILLKNEVITLRGLKKFLIGLFNIMIMMKMFTLDMLVLSSIFSFREKT